MKTKKNIKSIKLLALIFVLLIAVMSLIACSKSEQTPVAETVSEQTETEQVTKENPGKTIVDIYNAIINGDYDFVYENSSLTSSDIEIFKQEVNGIDKLYYVDSDMINQYNGYDLISIAADCTLADDSSTSFSGIYILKNGKLCSYSSIDDETMKKMDSYAKNYKENSQFWKDYGYDYSEPTTIANNYTNNKIACPICGGTGVTQEVIGVDANGLPQYSMVGCGGCGGSGWIYQ